MQRDDLYLYEIVEAADHIRDLLGSATLNAWIGDEMLRSAVLQKLTAIGEAARGLDAAIKARHP